VTSPSCSSRWTRCRSTASPAPRAGSSYVQPLLPLAFVFFGTAAVNPGIPLAAIGMPGCFSYSTADLGSLTAPVVAGTGTLPFAIPANPALVSASLTAQALAFSLVTPLNLVSSNGNSITVGF
jgi:hypothetical protein